MPATLCRTQNVNQGYTSCNNITRDSSYRHQREVKQQSSFCLNTLRPRQNGRHFADDIFKCIFLNENVWISIKISLKFVPKGPINDISALLQIMAWRHPGDKPLSEPMMVNLPTHICLSWPQWVNSLALLLHLMWNFHCNHQSTLLLMSQMFWIINYLYALIAIGWLHSK